MAVRYFCDRCDAETGEGELRSAELSIPPDADIALDLCPACVREVRAHIVGKSVDGDERGAFARESGPVS
jgi:hypothetical protein